jgi:UDP-N-acetylmuramoyl-tripeptide--D-alanyl-D-alanine ligase
VIPLSVGEIAGVVSGHLLGVDPEAIVQGVAVDSRTVEPGSVFVAISGARSDGHDFAAGAVDSGAVAVLAARALTDDRGDPLPCIVVDDPVVALGRLAGWVRRERLTCTVVAITGSSGKTSTKDLVGSLLSALGPTVTPRGSLNTEVGLPLTILAADESTRFLVLEMGMRGEGHISYLVEIARPDIGVVINVGSAHLGMLGTREAIARAKGELVAGLAVGGVAVLNADDPLVRAMAASTAATIVTYGESEGCDVRGTGVRLDHLARPSFTLTDIRSVPPRSVPVSLQFSGAHYVSNALAAAAVALSVGATPEQVADGLAEAVPLSPWRMEVRTAPGGFTVVNDAYNANPESMRAALATLAAMAAGRPTWAVLGEMRELGTSSAAEHEAIGRLVVGLGISNLLCVGEGTAAMDLGARDETLRASSPHGEPPVFVHDAEAAIAVLREQVQPGDVVLVKASRGVGLERVADALMTTVVRDDGLS